MSIDELIIKANELFRKANYNEALKFYDLATKKDPNHVIAWNNKGRAYQMLGDFNNALTCYNRASILDPSNLQVTKNKKIITEIIEKISSENNIQNLKSNIDSDETREIIKLLRHQDINFREKGIRKLNIRLKPNSYFTHDLDGNIISEKSKIDNYKEFKQIISDEAFNSIINLTKEENYSIKLGAIWSLGYLKDERAIPFLISFLGNKEAGIRGASSIQLLKFKEKALKDLLKCLKNDNKYMRREIVEILGNIKNLNTLKELLDCLDDKDWNVRFRAIIALGKLGDKKALEPIGNLMEDKSTNVRRKAAEIIGILMSGESIPTYFEMEELHEKEKAANIREYLKENKENQF